MQMRDRLSGRGGREGRGRGRGARGTGTRRAQRVAPLIRRII